jgi:cellulose synthase/poly-beta-1,6-N-acetylglucosamine synthase-like glycosyltransferase
MSKMVSVLIPAYNEEYNIRTCLDSVLKNKYENREIIVVNDASIDNTKRILDDYSRKHEDIIVINKSVNGGRGAALQTCLMAAKGEIIATTDADTMVPNYWIEKIVKHLSNDKIDIVSGNWEPSNPTIVAKTNNIIDSIFIRILKGKMSAGKNPGFNTAFKKKVLDKIGGFNREIRWGNDPYLYGEASKYGFKFYFDEELVVQTKLEETIKDTIKRRFTWGQGRAIDSKYHKLPFSKKIEYLSVGWIYVLLCLDIFAFILNFKEIINYILIVLNVFSIFIPVLAVLVYLVNLKRKIKVPNILITIPLIIFLFFLRISSNFFGYLYQKLSNRKITSWRSSI